MVSVDPLLRLHGAVADAGAVRPPAQAGRSGPPPRQDRLLRLVQPRLHHAPPRTTKAGSPSILRRTGRALVVFAALIARRRRCCSCACRRRSCRTKTRATIIANFQLPPGATLERTGKALARSRRIHPQAAGSGQHGRGAGLQLLRPGPEHGARLHHAQALGRAQGRRPQRRSDVAGRISGRMSQVRDAFIFAISPPPIPELGRGTGFSFRLQDRGGNGREALLAARNQLLGMAATEQGAGRRASGRPGRRAAGAARHRPRQGQRAWRELRRDQRRHLDLARFGLHQRLPERRPPAARGGPGRRAVAHAAGRPAQAERDQQPRPAGAAVGFRQHALGHRPDADGALQRLPDHAHLRATRRRATAPAKRWTKWNAWRPSCRPGFAFEWTGQSREEKLSGSTVFILLGFALLAVFLSLAALYESWSIPVAVLLVVPLGVLGALLRGDRCAASRTTCTSRSA